MEVGEEVKARGKWGCSIIASIMQITCVAPSLQWGWWKVKVATQTELLISRWISLMLCRSVTLCCEIAELMSLKYSVIDYFLWNDFPVHVNVTKYNCQEVKIQNESCAWCWGRFKVTHPDFSPWKWPLNRSWSSAPSGSSAGLPGRSSCPCPASPPWEARVLNAGLRGHTEREDGVLPSQSTRFYSFCGY